MVTEIEKRRARESMFKRYTNDPKFREERHVYMTEYFRKIAKEWRKGSQCKEPFDAERIAADIILPKEGFSNIILTSRNLVNGEQFPFFDVLCEKNGLKYGIAVTTGYIYNISRRKSLAILLNFLQLKYILYFVRPNLREYLSFEYESDKIPSGTSMSFRRLKMLRKI